MNGRVLVAELLKATVHCDVQKYLGMLVSAGETLLGVFGYGKDRINEEVLYRDKQATVKTFFHDTCSPSRRVVSKLLFFQGSG